MAFNLIDGQFVDGGSGGSESYLTLGANGDSDADITAWYGYAGTAGSNPATPYTDDSSLAISRNTTEPISGSGDIRISKPGSNQHGKGRWLEFTIENRHLARVLQVTFDARLSSGTYVTGDLRLSIIQDPNGTPVTIEPVNTAIQLGIAGQTVKIIATFQTHITVKDYAIALHVANANTNDYIIDFNNFRVWEPIANYGAIITDWEAYTPTVKGTTSDPTYGSGYEQKAYWRRNGSSLELLFNYWQTNAGSNGSGSYYIPLPNGLQIDTTKFQNLTFGGQNSIGKAQFFAGSTTYDGYSAVVNASGIGGEFNNGSGGSLSWGSSGCNFSNTTLRVTIQASVPIAGWGSNMALSSDAGDGREVKAQYTFNTGTSTTTGGTDGVKPTVRLVDSHSIFNTTTGAITIPVVGNYRFTLNQINNSTANNYYLWRSRNGGAITRVAYMGVIGTSGDSISVSYDCLIGDVMYISANNGVSSTLNATDGFQILSIERISASNQIIAPVETVACSYYSAATQTSLTTQINFGTKIYDTHNAVTTGASWKFTAPMSGKFLLTGLISSSDLNLYYKLRKNGSNYLNLMYMKPGVQNFTTVVDLLAGDYIDIIPNGSTIVNGNASYYNDIASRIEITRLGI